MLPEAQIRLLHYCEIHVSLKLTWKYKGNILIGNYDVRSRPAREPMCLVSTIICTLILATTGILLYLGH